MKTISSKIIILLLITIITCSCSSNKPIYMSYKNSDGEYLYKNRNELFKDYAYCSCLVNAYKEDNIDLEKIDYTRGFLFDIADDNLNFRASKIDSFTKAYRKSINYNRKNSQSFESRKSPMGECLELYKSKKLSMFLDSLLRKKS